MIVGASGRAAAASAVRAGLQPFVIDLFADEDTRTLCEVLQCPFEDYPHGFIELAKQAPPGPWMYTGGLENYPGVIAAISERRVLWGNGPEELAKVRDPFALAKILPMPEMRRAGEPLDPAKRWLRKPFRSSGGFGIAELSAPETGEASEVYFQERLEGLPYSALYQCSPSEVTLRGICSQLIGEPWLNAPPFRYCGNIGPLPTDTAMTAELRRMGEVLQPLGLRGWVGIDFLFDGDAIRVLEVNPRYTASVELYERERADQKIHGKAILYAERTFEVRADHPWRGPDFADIPIVGSVIPSGQPVVTLFASGDTEPECRERLQNLARECAPR